MYRPVLATMALLIALAACSGSSSSPSEPSPSPVLIARGNFVEHDFGPVEFEATREGSRVTGQMTVGPNWAGSNTFVVDLQCARETEDGLLMIGGSITEGNRFFPEGRLAWIAVRRGFPDRARVGAGYFEDVPATQTTDCLAYLDGWLQFYRSVYPRGEWVLPNVLDGTVEFAP